MKRRAENFIEHLQPVQIILIGFLLAILLGTLLLMLPVSVQRGAGASFSDALFTATSAVCVTGLVVRDTASFWSPFGQAVILALIQIGGLGVITIATALMILSGRRIGLMQRGLMQTSISAPQMQGIIRCTRFILLAAFGFEGAGAAAMFPVFARDFGPWKGAWYAVFHSVSAFCNAGFDLMGEGHPYVSLTAYAADPVINAVIMALIIIGGIGFLTWADAAAHGFHLREYRMQSKAALCVSAVLIILPALYFFCGEFERTAPGERVLLSLFQSVTTRTAGFNTADLGALSETGVFIMILLMLIGGSPASTAGGMKTTTAAVLMASALSVFRKRKDASLFHRRVSEECIRSAGAILLLYLCLFSLGGIIISRTDSLPLMKCMFEAASAIGTVGLTLGITPQLSLLSRGVLVFLMYFGRVGGLTLIYAAFPERKPFYGREPEEQISVG